MAEGSLVIRRLAAGLVAVALGGCLALPLRAEEVTIRAFRADPTTGLVDIFSDQGTWQREVPVSQLPAPPIAVVGASDNGILLQAEGVGWVKRTQVLTSDMAEARAPGELVGCASTGEHQSAAVGRGLGNSARPHCD
ncbi:hypothetical protein [Roseospirillum parvum]|uniref:Uncharacterized protein n=1 Tax=Roseospirillum parvum TaxID=83401 RepID=A0A1G7UHE4_9PROT|nr:hypothetical protein [Roseospirillum parvum]SDG46671.1 hypothetical protein SAMN05421742_101324 [Roseospirillum parvum]